MPFFRSTMYQSTGSLHSDSHSSNSMSPAPSPSPTHLKGVGHNGQKLSAGSGPVSQSGGGPIIPSGTQPRNLSGSLSNLSLTKKWGSSSDFREGSPGPGTPNGQAVHRRLQQTGSNGKTVMVELSQLSNQAVTALSTCGPP